MTKCKYCDRDRNYSCVNTRDMEDAAVSGDRECFYQLAKLGGGEKGIAYVVNNCEALRAKRYPKIAEAEAEAIFPISQGVTQELLRFTQQITEAVSNGGLEVKVKEDGWNSDETLANVLACGRRAVNKANEQVAAYLLHSKQGD